MQTATRSHRFELLFGAGLIGLPTVLMTAWATAVVRDIARRSRCAQNTAQIAISQKLWANASVQKGQPARYIQGTEAEAAVGGILATAPLVESTDPSRAYTLMHKRKFFDNLVGLACPADPFVAVLDAPGDCIDTLTVDMPEELKFGPATFASPGSPAMTELDHTFFSYSMQAGSRDKAAHLGPAMSGFLPVVGERNPYDAITTHLGGDPAEGSEAGNSFNHNRRGGSFAFKDGRAEWLADARRELPRTAGGETPDGWDYLYDDRAPSPTALGPRPAGTTVPARGTAIRMNAVWGGWLVH